MWYLIHVVVWYQDKVRVCVAGTAQLPKVEDFVGQGAQGPHSPEPINIFKKTTKDKMQPKEAMEAVLFRIFKMLLAGIRTVARMIPHQHTPPAEGRLSCCLHRYPTQKKLMLSVCCHCIIALINLGQDRPAGQDTVGRTAGQDIN